MLRWCTGRSETRNDQPSTDDDASNGWEAVAARFLARRSNIGVATVREWSRSLPSGAPILDLGCGSGVPISQTLINDGFLVYGIDASPSLVAAFRQRFPHAEVTCEAAEISGFFGKTFEGIIAVGLMFLMSADTQRTLIRRVASALKPGGRFLFTSPAQPCTWADLLTGRQSQSLGAEVYKSILADAGLTLVGESDDEGDNHYFEARS